MLLLWRLPPEQEHVLPRSLTSALGNEVKLNVVADIESLKDQLAKPSPNPTVVKTLWSGIEKAAAVAGLEELALTVAPHVQRLLS